MSGAGVRHWILAACLSALAGYIDAVGFLQLGGLFVSFMSGNSTRLSVGIATGAAHTALLAAGLITCFVLGVVAGSLIARGAGRARKPAVIGFVTIMLAVAYGLELALAGHWISLCMAAAMGAVNCVFQRDDEVDIGVTYMTGALVTLGQHLAHALVRDDRFGWLPYFALWIALVIGAIIGALVFKAAGSASLLPAIGVSLVLTIFAFLVSSSEKAEQG